MASDATWIFVDDQEAQATSFADEIRDARSGICVEVCAPDAARERLFARPLEVADAPAGILMDVDFSTDASERGTGPGLAQDIRLKQKAGEVPEFPIVRFARKEIVKTTVLGDPTSDDLFDLKIQKEDVRRDKKAVQDNLVGITNIYFYLSKYVPSDGCGPGSLLGLEGSSKEWSDPQFEARLASSKAVATHVASSAFMNAFILPAGLLIDKFVLSIRLGVDHEKSGTGWDEFIQQFEFKYKGAGANEFGRWWARGLEEWWLDRFDEEVPLSALTVEERFDRLKGAIENTKLERLDIARGSPGDRPWGLCALGLEDDPPERIPIDPMEAVQFTLRVDMPSWVDPAYASLGRASESRGDFRINQNDLNHLKAKYR